MARILMNWKSTVVVSGAGLVATVFGWVSTPVVPQRASAPTAAATTAPAPSAAADIQQEAARLQSRIGPDPTYRQPSRNPFRFAPRVAPRHVELPAPAQETPAIVVPALPRPTIRLRGIATDTVDGATERTAIVTTDAGLLFVREGEMAGNYRVTKIDDEGMELTGPGETIRLALSGR